MTTFNDEVNYGSLYWPVLDGCTVNVGWGMRFVIVPFRLNGYKKSYSIKASPIDDTVTHFDTLPHHFTL